MWKGPDYRPTGPWILGIAGLAPFIVGAILFAFGPVQHGGLGLLMLLTWSAVVLSFLGGARWGLEMAKEAPRFYVMATAILPAAAAWGLVALLAIDRRWQIAGFIVAYLLQWLWDVKTTTPPWYQRLRTVLTVGALIALAVAMEQALHF